MQHRFSFRHSKLTSRACFFTILLFCLALVGCSNYCFVFVSNPGGSISTSSNTPSCQLNTATGTVSLRVTASPTSSAQATPLPTTIQHIFVTLRGIEATPSTIPNDDSPNWRELAPQLASQPEQLDLLAQCAESCEQNTFGDVAVPADAYRQIRLQPLTQSAGDGRASTRGKRLWECGFQLRNNRRWCESGRSCWTAFHRNFKSRQTIFPAASSKSFRMPPST